MAISTAAIGKGVAPRPTVYAVGREKVREYALAVGETNPLHLDVEAARAAGYADVVAPPMFAVVYSGAGDVAGDASTPRSGMDFAMLVHGAPGVRVGPGGGRRRRDHDRPPRSRTSPSAAGWASTSSSRWRENQRDETVCTGTWTNIVEGSE